MQIGKFKDVKVGVTEYFQSRDLKGKVILDIPAGKGLMTEYLSGLGAQCKSFDLFTHGRKVGNITIERADLMKKLPMEDSSADYILCQEGIEHLSDQLSCMREFKRILKDDGRLLVTTPNLSSLRAKFFTFFTENNSLHHLPPSEVDDVASGEGDELFCGHLFLLGIQRLRMLGILAGLRLNNVFPTRLSRSSLILFPLFYPAILLLNSISYRRSLRKGNRRAPERRAERIKSLQKIRRLNITPAILISDHLFVEFSKSDTYLYPHDSKPNIS